MFAYFIVSFLKAWKVTVVWIDCDDAIITRRSRPYQKLISQEKNLNSASKVENWITVFPRIVSAESILFRSCQLRLLNEGGY